MFAEASVQILLKKLHGYNKDERKSGSHEVVQNQELHFIPFTRSLKPYIYVLLFGFHLSHLSFPASNPATDVIHRCLCIDYTYLDSVSEKSNI